MNPIADVPASPRQDAPVGGAGGEGSHVEPWHHQPGLDGLRAVAVAAVLAYHGRIDGMAGGFLGVSTFFTLSGFLITSLLIREQRGHGSVDLRRFWGRRVRRLVPASLATQALVVGFAVVGIWDDDQMRALRGDVPAALAQVVNWHFIAGDRSYGDRFSSPSPLEHFWSLAVEEQFYLLFPLVVWAGLRLGRGRIRPLVITLIVATGVSAAVNGWLGSGATDRAYFGTDTRLAELAIGALLACLTLPGVVVVPTWRPWFVAGGFAGLAVSAVLWVVARTNEAWLYPWGLLATAAASCAMVLGAVQPGLLQQALSIGPLQWLGRISYGVYLYHWPVFLWLSPARIGWGTWPLMALRLAVTLALAELSARFVESPVRLRRLLPSGRTLIAGLLPVAAAVLAAGLVVTADLPPAESLQAASARADRQTPAPVARPQRILVIGDALAGSLGGRWKPDPADVEVRVAAAPGCGIMVAGFVRLADGRVERDSDRCRGVHPAWVGAERDFRPDVVVVWTGLRDLADRRLSILTEWVGPSDPAVGDLYRTEVAGLAESLGAGGARVVFLTVPPVRNTTSLEALPAGPGPGEGGDPGTEALQLAAASQGVPPAGFAENDDARVAQLNLVLRSASDDIVDASGFMSSWPAGPLDPDARPDGVGLNDVGADRVGVWLAAQLGGVRRSATPAAAAPDRAREAVLPPAPPEAPRRVVQGRPVRALVVGDSVAFGHAFGLDQWAQGSGQVSVANSALFGCPVARGGSFRFLGEVDQFPERCDWRDRFPQLVSDQDPDLVVLTSGIWEVVDRLLPGDTKWRHLGDPVVDQYLRAELLGAVDALGAGGATVVIVDYPHLEAGINQGYTNQPESDPARVDRLNEIFRQIEVDRPGVVRVLPFGSWLASQPGGEMDPLKRKDGIHFRDEYAPTIGAWLGPQLLDIARGA